MIITVVISIQTSNSLPKSLIAIAVSLHTTPSCSLPTPNPEQSEKTNRKLNHQHTICFYAQIGPKQHAITELIPSPSSSPRNAIRNTPDRSTHPHTHTHTECLHSLRHHQRHQNSRQRRKTSSQADSNWRSGLRTRDGSGGVNEKSKVESPAEKLTLEGGGVLRVARGIGDPRSAWVRRR